MSTTIIRPLVPLPLSDDTDTPDTDTSVTRRGYGAWFCGRGHDDDHAPMTVEDHDGPWCESLSIGYVDGYTDDGRVMPLGLHLVRPFLHETRLMFVVNATSDHEDERVEVFLSAGDVRRLAASLLYAADHIDGLTRPLEVQTGGL